MTACSTVSRLTSRIIHERSTAVVGEGAPRGGLFRDAVNTSLYAPCPDIPVRDGPEKPSPWHTSAPATAAFMNNSASQPRMSSYAYLSATELRTQVFVVVAAKIDDASGRHVDDSRGQRRDKVAVMTDENQRSRIVCKRKIQRFD